MAPIALTSCVSNNSTVGTSASRSRHEFSVTQIDLLEVLVEAAGRERAVRAVRCRRGAVLACDSSAARVRPDEGGRLRSNIGAPASACRVGGAPRTSRAVGRRRRRVRRSWPPRAPSCVGRTAGGRRTVWQALLTMKSSRSYVFEEMLAERLDARACGEGRARRSRDGRPSRRSRSRRHIAWRHHAGSGSRRSGSAPARSSLMPAW